MAGVVDVPPKLSARARVFSTGPGRKTDATDAHSVALVGSRITGDEVGRITLRTLDNDKARNVLMDLNDDDNHEANRANVQRRMVSVTGVLEREPGRALRFKEVIDLHVIENLPSIPTTAT